MVLNTTSTVGRADLLHALVALGDAGLVHLAGALGYEKQARALDAEAEQAPVAADYEAVLSTEAPPAPLDDWPMDIPPPRFFHLTRRATTRAPTDVLPPPAWLRGAKSYGRDARPALGSMVLPRHRPLVRWSRLWPVLKSELGSTLRSRRADVPRLVAEITRGHAVRTIPRLLRADWSGQICVVLDYSESSLPFWDDFTALVHDLIRVRGRHAVDARVMRGVPGPQQRYQRLAGEDFLPWQWPASTTPLLVLSDVGVYDSGARVSTRWSHFAARAAAAGCSVVTLAPVPAALQPAARARVLAWDRDSRLRPRSTRAADPLPGIAAGIEALLTLLAPAVNMEWALLRAARELLPAASASVAVEALLRTHPAVEVSTSGARLKPAKVAAYQACFFTLAPALQKQLVALLKAHHGALADSVRYAELANCARLAPAALSSDEHHAIKNWQHNTVQTLLEHGDSGALAAWAERHTTRQGPDMWQDNAPLAAIWALTQREAQARGEVLELPPGVTQQAVEYFLRPVGTGGIRRCTLRQVGETLLLLPAGGDGAAGSASRGSWLADVELHSAALYVRRDDAELSQPAPWRLLSYRDAPLVVARLAPTVAQIALRTEYEELDIDGLDKPQNVPAMARDEEGLFITAAWLGQHHRLSWVPPAAGTREGQWQGPSPLGVDAYGLYAEPLLADIRQRFRWIAPGSFMMGSPADEPERSDDEHLHEVRLTRGFWLADTACTQALWLAVMGNKPSRFTGNSLLPVEQVSWDDIQTFLRKLNARMPGLDARLPSEAQWEYACRAGTATAFSFGANVTPAQVNYHGNYPYSGGAQGEFRQQSAPVASLPPNWWGLYEMHGNVWEWCADWSGDYADGRQVDPTGPDTGTGRVLRGGSWYDFGGRARSAYRIAYEPVWRGSDVGFRLALGQVSTAGELGPTARPRGTRGGEGGTRDAERPGLLTRLGSLFRRK